MTILLISIWNSIIILISILLFTFVSFSVSSRKKCGDFQEGNHISRISKQRGEGELFI